MKEGLNSYFEYRNLDKEIEINSGTLIKDDKDKNIGKFININLKEEDITNDIGTKIKEENKENHIDNIEIISNKAKINFENKEKQTIFDNEKYYSIFQNIELEINNNKIIDNTKKDKDNVFNIIEDYKKIDEAYELKLNNISYYLQIYIDDTYIYFKLFQKNIQTFYFMKKYDLKSILELLNLSPDIFNDLSKIKILFNEAYNNNKLTLASKENNIKLIIKIIINENYSRIKEIDCPIELNKENIGIVEKIKFILEDLEKFKNNKNILLLNENLLEIEKYLKYLQNSIKKMLFFGINMNEEKIDNNLILDNKKDKMIMKELQELKASKIIEDEAKDEFNQNNYIEKNKINDKQQLKENDNDKFNNINDIKKYENNNDILGKDLFNEKNMDKAKNDLSKKEVFNSDINSRNILNQNKDEINILKDLKAIENQVNKNYELLKFKNDGDMNEYFYEECYLINKEWLKHEINKYNNKEGIIQSKSIDIKMSPKVKEIERDLFKYPIDFGFVEKSKYESIIKDLISKDKDIKIEDFCSAEIFFVNYQNNIPKEYRLLYMGTKIENNIFFYKASKFNFIYEFLISYENMGIINREIQKYIIK